MGRLLQFKPNRPAVIRATPSPRARRRLGKFSGFWSNRYAAKRGSLMRLVGYFSPCVCALSDWAARH